MAAKKYSCLLLVVLATLLHPASAQTPRAEPDVLALVYQMPGGQDQVGLTYAKIVSHTQALRDLKALQQETGWLANGLQITDAAAPMQSRAVKMTSVSFESPGVAPPDAHSFPVEPFVHALRGYHRLVLVFIADRGFQFQGLRHFADNHVQIVLEQHDSAYTYQVSILDPHFDTLNLPTLQANAPSASVAAPSGAAGRSFGLVKIALLVAAALAAGVLVYFLTARMGRIL